VAANKRTKIQRERDRLTIAELLLKGWSQQRIADWLDLDKSGVSREVKRIKVQWQSETIEDTHSYVQAELRRLAMLEAEHWAAWERSQQSKETSHLEKLLTGKDESGVPTGRVKQATKAEQRVGDAVFLSGIQKVIDARCKLLGLYPTERESASEIHLSDAQLGVIGSLMGEAIHGGGH